MKLEIVRSIKKEIEFLRRIQFDRKSIDSDLLEAYPEWTPEWAGRREYEELERLREFESLDLSQEEIGKLYVSCRYGRLLVHDRGNLFESTSEMPHDLFRKYDYPNTVLRSLSETLDYISDPANECKTYPNTVEWLTQFWKTHPDGLIKFG